MFIGTFLGKMQMIVNAWFRGKVNIGWAQSMDRLGEKVGGESCVKSRNKY